MREQAANKIRGLVVLLALAAVFGSLTAVHFACAPPPQKPQISPERQKAIQDSLRRVWEFERNKWWSTGYENYKNKLYKRAIKPFWKVIKLDTTHIFKDLPYRYLADSYWQLGKPDSAEVVYKLGLKVFPKSQQLHRNLGYLYMGKEMIPEAIHEYEQAVTVDSGTVDDYKILGNLYVRNDELDKAIEAYQKVLEMNPNDQEVRKVLAELYKTTGRTEEAVAAMEEALKNDPNNTKLLYDLGKAYYQNQEWEKALEKFQKLSQLKPNDAGVLMYIGNTYEQLEQWRNAIKAYEKVLKLDPQNKRALVEIANCYKNLGQFARARSYVRRALKIDPNYGLAHLTLGEIYMSAADKCSEGRKITFDDKLIYKMAYNEFLKAKNDPEASNYAQRDIEYVTPLIPTKEDYFMHPDQKKATSDCYKWIYR